MVELDKTSLLCNSIINKIYSSGPWSIISFLIIVFLFQWNGTFILYSSIFTSYSISFECGEVYNETSEVCLEFSNCSQRNKNFKWNKEEVYSSIVSDLLLICERKYFIELLQASLILGIFIGGFIGPILGDRYGRRSIFIWVMFLSGLVGLITIFTTNIHLMICIKFLLGILRECSGTNAVVLSMELIPTNLQCRYGLILELFYCLAIAGLSILGYFIRDWKYLQIVGSLTALCAPFCFLIISESPRWLINQNKLKELEINLKKFPIYFNKLSSTYFNDILKNPYYNQSSTIKLYSLPKWNIMLTIWSGILIINWIQTANSMFAMNFIISTIHGNMYLNLFISAILDAFGLFLGFILLPRSRLLSMLVLQSSQALFLAISLISSTLISRICLIIAKGCVIGSAYVLTVTGLYVFPSNLRTFGSCSTMAIGKLSAIMSPYLVQLYVTHKILATSILSIFSIVNCITTLFYPDWVNKPFPESVKDLKIMKKSIPINKFCVGNAQN